MGRIAKISAKKNPPQFRLFGRRASHNVIAELFRAAPFIYFKFFRDFGERPPYTLGRLSQMRGKITTL